MQRDCTMSTTIVCKKRDEWHIKWQRMITSDSEWYNDYQRITTSGTTSDNEWQRVAISANSSFFE